ncbi:Wall-associated receptor kinase-like 8 [Morella rubra]|uniref:Wall-associated receptor kinase-like 8 n=1 Tax=Morella rubra TaxID=262757 RepID=A0A6A1VQW2_9ROSI|nr:Wall-associated receptor kinase-like 8 [Morella rubra]
MALQMVFRIMFLLSTLDPFSHATKLAKGSCPDHCGNVSIPYPFGMGADHCYLADWFAVDCNINKSSGSATPHLRISRMEVVDIQLGGTMYLKVRIVKTFSGGVGYMNYTQRGRPFTYSQTKNRFVAVGCNNFASIQSPNDVSVTIGGCMSVCDKTRSVLNASDCNGINCCQTAIPSGLDQEFILDISPIDGRMVGESASAFLVDTEWFKKNFRMPIPDDYMVVEALQWQIDSSLFNSLGLSGNAEGSSTSPTSYHCSNQSAFGNKRSLAFTCSCNPGYEGNPYLPEGCQDVDECADPNLNTCSRYLSYENGQSTHEKMGCKNTNGSYECYSIKNTRLRIKGVIIGVSTGVGVPFLLISGWGSYKVLKKRKIMKRKEKFFKRNGGLLLKQQLFSSEVNVGNPNLFTSKDLEKATDNFNVNRILEVPLFVYEFIPNGTLFQYLHNCNEDFSLKWDMHLRIATEVAGALFYLHSTATLPVYRRDIKSTNILLEDEKYRAKIADFGTSRSIAVDQSHLTT